MNIRLDFDPGKFPGFIDQMPTWQRELAHEVYNCFIQEDEKWEEHCKNRKAVELFWGGEPVQRPPYQGRYRLDQALEDFAEAEFGKDITVVCTDTSGKPYLQAEIPLGTWLPGGLMVNDFHVMMRSVWEKAGRFFGDWRFSFTIEERNPKIASSWIVRLHPKDFVCSDGVWNTVTEKWCELVKKNER